MSSQRRFSDRVVLLSTFVVEGMHWKGGGGGVRPNNFPVPNWNHFPIVISLEINFWEPKTPHFFSFRQFVKPFTLSMHHAVVSI